jgi:hypothetical protein
MFHRRTRIFQKEKAVPDKYTIIEPGKRPVVYNWLQYFDEESLRSEFEANGFVAGKAICPQSAEIAVVAGRS